jgi:hypothetical protein
MFGISESTVNYLKETYPVGTRVMCDYMDDPRGVPSGTKGTVRNVDDMGTVHVSWDNGQGLGLAYGEDSYHKITE